MFSTLKAVLSISGVAIATTAASAILQATKKPEQAELAKLAGLAVSGGIVLECVRQLVIQTYQTVSLFF